MRRNNISISKIALIIFIIIVLLVICVKLLFKNANSEYTDYVNKYIDAVEKYIDNDLSKDFIEKSYTFDELNSVLLSNGYLQDFSDKNVKISSENIVFVNNNNEVSFYNYINETTLENRFELNFTKDGKTYTCTKTECK